MRSSKFHLDLLTNELPPTEIIKTAVHPETSKETLFLATATGTIYQVNQDLTTNKFLEISDLVSELHGLEFHSRFSKNGRFYLHYTHSDRKYDTIEEWILPGSGVPFCLRTLINFKSDYSAKNTLTWACGKLFLITKSTGDPNLTQSNRSLDGKIILFDPEYSPWRFSPNPAPVENLDQLDPVRRESFKVVGKGLINPTGLDLAKPYNYLADQRIIPFKKWKINLEHFSDPNQSSQAGQMDQPRTQNGHLLGGKVSCLGNSSYYFYSESSGQLIARSPSGNLTLVGLPDVKVTGIGVNLLRTTIFVSGLSKGKGVLYQLK